MAFCGIIANQHLVKNNMIVAICQLVTGTTLALCLLYGSYWSFIVLAVVFGFFCGAIFSMTPSIIVDFVGKENFRTAIGILIMGQDVTLGTGAPLLDINSHSRSHPRVTMLHLKSFLLPPGRIPLLYPVRLLHGEVSDSVWTGLTDGTVCQKTSGQNGDCGSTAEEMALST